LDLAAAHPADLRRIDAQLREVRSKMADAVRASGTTFTGAFGGGPVIVAAVLGDVADLPFRVRSTVHLSP
jgi:hypothetical protein